MKVANVIKEIKQGVEYNVFRKSLKEKNKLKRMKQEYKERFKDNKPSLTTAIIN